MSYQTQSAILYALGFKTAAVMLLRLAMETKAKQVLRRSDSRKRPVRFNECLMVMSKQELISNSQRNRFMKLHRSLSATCHTGRIKADFREAIQQVRRLPG